MKPNLQWFSYILTGTTQFVLLNLILLCSGSGISDNEVGSDSDSPKPEDVVAKFNAKEIPGNVLYRPLNRYEYGERNTSAAYDLWDKIDMVLVEWPGNITTREPDYPLLKWDHGKAKFAKNQCNVHLGMNFYGYAYKYVHLTWGPFRMTTSYCPPLKIPRKIFKGTSLEASSSATSVSVSDFEFVSDAFLVIVENRFIARVGKLEPTYQDEGTLTFDRDSLSYSLATGISLRIDKLITESCCPREKTCKQGDGDTVIAYSAYSSDFSIFWSHNGGIDFKLLTLSKPTLSPRLVLQTVMLFPIRNEVLVFYGGEVESTSEMGRYSLKTGHLLNNVDPTPTRNDHGILKNVKGQLQSKKLGKEMSFLVWDNCHAWYSPDAGASIVQALFYYHNSISRTAGAKQERNKQHLILPYNCRLKRSSLAYDHNGKIGLLDSMNNFFYGIDLKSTKYFPLVATTVDMTLMKKGTENSIVPNFDLNSRPKLMYPPKYLPCNHSAVQNKEFAKRLAVKLFFRTIFPSDFMVPFYDENIPKRYKYLGLQRCLTSGITLNSSLSQKPEVFTNSEPITFQLEFKSFSDSMGQLHIEPDYYKEYFHVRQKLLDFAQLGSASYYYFKYNIVITLKQNSNLHAGDFIRLNFYTVKSLRCIHQPQQTVWIENVKKKKAHTDTACPTNIV